MEECPLQSGHWSSFFFKYISSCKGLTSVWAHYPAQFVVSLPVHVHSIIKSNGGHTRYSGIYVHLSKIQLSTENVKLILSYVMIKIQHFGTQDQSHGRED